ncbi:hypothetical protein HK104_006332, partial [Borealophlyctis nickersoniae]
MSARLRDAVPEYVRLDERYRELGRVEGMVKHVQQKLEHIAAEIRGAVNEEAYLCDRWNRERQNMANAILVPKQRRSEHGELMEDIKRRLEQTQIRERRLRFQHQGLMDELGRLEPDLRALHHVRSLIEALFDRIFDGAPDFPKENELKRELAPITTRTDKLAAKGRSIEAAQQVLSRMQSLLREGTPMRVKNGTGRPSMDLDHELEILGTAKQLFQEAIRILPTLSKSPLGRSGTTTLISPNLSPEDQHRELARHVEDTSTRLNRSLATIHRELAELEPRFRDLKSRLLRVRTRILRAAVLNRDRDRASRDRGGSEYGGDDLPPPYAPPGYNAVGESPRDATATTATAASPAARSQPIPIPLRTATPRSHHHAGMSPPL